MKVQAIIFDLDGTLWDSVEGVKKSFNEVLEKHPETKARVTKEFLQSVMGLQMEEIAKRLFTDVEEAQQVPLFKICSEVECAYLAEHGGTLYPDLEETLQVLSKSYQLMIVSNCQEGYIEAFLKAHHMKQYFADFENAGRTGFSKGENIKLIMKRNGLQEAVYVGDTAGDQKASEVAGLPFVYAAYGFGEVTACDYEINCFKDLLNYF